eukprot:3941908-Rhodomonas_salina.2
MYPILVPLLACVWGAGCVVGGAGNLRCASAWPGLGARDWSLACTSAAACTSTLHHPRSQHNTHNSNPVPHTHKCQPHTPTASHTASQRRAGAYLSLKPSPLHVTYLPSSAPPFTCPHPAPTPSTLRPHPSSATQVVSLSACLVCDDWCHGRGVRRGRGGGWDLGLDPPAILQGLAHLVPAYRISAPRIPYPKLRRRRQPTRHSRGPKPGGSEYST